MANIKQQKKRVGVAARERLENLRYKSTAKTLLKALQDHVNLGDKDAAEKTHRELVQLLDRAVSRKALHRNTVARKKSRAARILISEPVKESKVVRRSRKKAPLRKPKAVKAETATATEAKAKPARATKAKAKPVEAEAPAAETTEVEAEAPAAETTEVEAPVAESAPAPEATEEAAADAGDATTEPADATAETDEA